MITQCDNNEAWIIPYKIQILTQYQSLDNVTVILKEV